MKLMKKIIFTLLLSFAIAIGSDAQVRVGPFLGYGDGLGLWGIGAYSEIVLNERVSISPVFTQYFPKTLDNRPRKSMWEVNANLNYYVITGEVGYLYGLTGLNYTNIKIRDNMGLTDEPENDGNLGLNLGLGTMVRVNEMILPFVEGKYTVGGYSQLAVIFGVKFQLGDRTLDEDY
jgi:outer membrane immunogenic protein